MNRVDRILEILDVGLQDTTPTHYGYGDVEPREPTYWVDVSDALRDYAITPGTADDFIAAYDGLVAARGITVEEAMQWCESVRFVETTLLGARWRTFRPAPAPSH